MVDLTGKRVLMIGGAGNIGSHVTDIITAEYKADIIIFDNFIRGKIDNLEESLSRQELKIVKGDICDRKALDEVFEGVDYVFHFASAWLLQCLENPRLSLDVNVVGTYNVLEACVKHNVKKLVFSSSASVFGDPSYIPVDEKHPFNTNSAYGASKVANEQYCEVFRHMYGLKYVGLRYFNVYGPRQDVKGAFTQVLPKWLDRIDRGEGIEIYGDGSQTMDFVFVKDVAGSNLCALHSDVEYGFYNIGTGVETSVREFANLLLELTGARVEIKYIPQDICLVNRRCSATEKAEKDLGFTYRVTLREGLKEFMAWRTKELEKTSEKSIA